jgi:hypothetical protein
MIDGAIDQQIASGQCSSVLQQYRLFRDDARDLYEAELVLIRPDQIVAWRGNRDESAAEIVGCVLGLRASRMRAMV